MKILSTEEFHSSAEDTFRRRVERFPLNVQQEVAMRAINHLFIEGDASDSELLLMDNARAFVSAERAEANDTVIWQLGQLIQQRAYDAGTLETAAATLWHFLARYNYPKPSVEDAAGERTELDSSGPTGRVIRSSSGGWSFIEF